MKKTLTIKKKAQISGIMFYKGDEIVYDTNKKIEKVAKKSKKKVKKSITKHFKK